MPLSDEGIEHFENLLADLEQSDHVFQIAEGRIWKASDQTRPLAAACERAKITRAITFHGLRDTYASMLAMRGVPLSVIAQALGHSDSRTTEKHYAHLAPNYVAETIKPPPADRVGDITPPWREDDRVTLLWVCNRTSRTRRPASVMLNCISQRSTRMARTVHL